MISATRGHTCCLQPVFLAKIYSFSKGYTENRKKIEILLCESFFTFFILFNYYFNNNLRFFNNISFGNDKCK